MTLASKLLHLYGVFTMPAGNQLFICLASETDMESAITTMTTSFADQLTRVSPMQRVAWHADSVPEETDEVIVAKMAPPALDEEVYVLEAIAQLTPNGFKIVADALGLTIEVQRPQVAFAKGKKNPKITGPVGFAISLGSVLDVVVRPYKPGIDAAPPPALPTSTSAAAAPPPAVPVAATAATHDE